MSAYSEAGLAAWTKELIITLLAFRNELGLLNGCQVLVCMQHVSSYSSVGSCQVLAGTGHSFFTEDLEG